MFRLTASETLDLEFDHSWNCVAFSVDGAFGTTFNNLFRQAGGEG